jgi:hypothetical protein
MSKQQMPALLCSTRSNKNSCAAGQTPDAAVLSVPRTLRCFFRSPTSRSHSVPERWFCLVGAGLAPPGVNLGTMKTAEQPGVPSRVVVFGNLWNKARPRRARPARLNTQPLSGAHHHAIRRHAIRHHPNYVARERCGLAPNSSVLAASRIATPGSSIAETNSSGSAPGKTSPAAHTIDRC